MSISEIRRRLEADDFFVPSDIKTLLDLIDRMKAVISEVHDNYSWPDVEISERVDAILKELEETE